MNNLIKLEKFIPRRFRTLIKKRVLDSSWFSSLYIKWIQEEIKKIEQGDFKPLIVYIETTNVCNAKCIICPREEMRRDLGIMSMDLYRKIVDQCVEMEIPEVRLHNIGEPLLDREIHQKIKYAKGNGIPKVLMYTNASLFDKKISEDIIFSGLDEIYISFDAAKKETYETIRKGLNFDRVLKGIETFLEVKAVNGQNKPKVHFAYTCMDLNRKEIHKFKSRWKRRVDSIGIFDVCDWAGQKEINSEIYHFNKKWPCVYLWKTMFILWNGDVSICCLDFDGKIRFGNAMEEPIKRIWKNDKFNYFRELHLKGKYNHIPLCSKCKLNRWWFQYKE